MKYLIQIDGTDPKNWHEIAADSPQDAIAEAIKPLILDGPDHDPQTAYVALAYPKFKHENGAPIAVQSYSLKVNREDTRRNFGR